MHQQSRLQNAEITIKISAATIKGLRQSVYRGYLGFSGDVEALLAAMSPIPYENIWLAPVQQYD